MARLARSSSGLTETDRLPPALFDHLTDRIRQGTVAPGLRGTNCGDRFGLRDAQPSVLDAVSAPFSNCKPDRTGRATVISGSGKMDGMVPVRGIVSC
jgi:hypothetical protein